MIFRNKNYTVEFDSNGAIVSLKSGGKQFVKTRLPLFALQLRNGNETKRVRGSKKTSPN